MTDKSTDPFEDFAASLAATEEAYKKTADGEPPLAAPWASEAEQIDAYVSFLEWEKQRKAAEAAYVKARKAAFSAPVNRLADDLIHKYGDAFGSMFPAGYAFAGEKHAINITAKEAHKFDQSALRRLDVNYMSGRPASESLPGLAPKYAVDLDAVPATMKADVASAISSTTTKPVITPLHNAVAAIGGGTMASSAFNAAIAGKMDD